MIKSRKNDKLLNSNLVLEDTMAVRYDKLFHLLVDRKISNIELTRMAGFSGNVMTRLKRDQYISLDSVETICRVLDCKVDDILEFVEEDK